MLVSSLKRIGVAAVCSFVSSMSANALVISASNPTDVVVDGVAGTSKVTLNPGPVILGMEVSISFLKCGDPFSTPVPNACPGNFPANPAEIEFILTNIPSGLSVTLIARNQFNDSSSSTAPASPGGPLTLRFSDLGGDIWGKDGYVDSGNPYRANQQFSIFADAASQGMSLGDEWVLSIDDFGQLDDPLGLTNFTLSITVPDRVRVPEPATLALLGLGLIGLAALRRRI